MFPEIFPDRSDPRIFKLIEFECEDIQFAGHKYTNRLQNVFNDALHSDYRLQFLEFMEQLYEFAQNHYIPNTEDDLDIRFQDYTLSVGLYVFNLMHNNVLFDDVGKNNISTNILYFTKCNH